LSPPLPLLKEGDEKSSIEFIQKSILVSGFKISPFGGGLRGRIPYIRSTLLLAFLLHKINSIRSMSL